MLFESMPSESAVFPDPKYQPANLRSSFRFSPPPLPARKPLLRIRRHLTYSPTSTRCIAQNFLHSIEEHFRHEGTICEKYNVVSGDASVRVATGYKANVVGFGWTNGVYVSMIDLLQKPIAASNK